MYKKILALSSFLLFQTSLLAMDLNETVKIIDEASAATQKLQAQFDNLLSETNSSVQKKRSKEAEPKGLATRGLTIYKTRIKPYCEMSGETFAKQYAQEDWDDIYAEHEFKNEVLKACPKMKEKYEDKWTIHLYQFSLEYASDSDSIPDC